jgi:4-alpha-glucanotransferase
VFFLDRRCGILLSIPSLNGNGGIGDLGTCAHRFADFLAEAGQSIWQVLPLTETDSALGNSPYSSPSAFAGNPLYISLEDLVVRGLLDESEISSGYGFPEDFVDYGAAREFRFPLLRKAFSRFTPGEDYFTFLHRQSFWLSDYALFSALKAKLGGTSWHRWPEPLRRRESRAIQDVSGELGNEIDHICFLQYLFFSQAASLKEKCTSLGIELIGDIPIYVNYDSADVWAHREYFCLGEDLLPTEVAGVPPDYFSKTGQLWGNPLYNWDNLKKDDFSWWVRRLEHSLNMFHSVRIDHFRGLLAYWAVPFGEKTAERGAWKKVPSSEFFDCLSRKFPSAPFLAENLGVITPDVTETMERMGFPGMAVLLFAFGGDMRENPHIPHNYVHGLTAYTGTHDNNTVRGWFLEDSTAGERRTLEEYCGREITAENAPDALIRLVFASVAERAVIPLQDHLGLGSEARMNTPSTPSGNWRWKVRKSQLTKNLSSRMKILTELYGRNRTEISKKA